MGIQVISFHCILKNKLGRVLSSTFNQDVLTHPNKPGDMLAGLADGLKNLKAGERREIFLRAEEAYGYYDPQKVIVRARDTLPKGETLKVGDRIAVKQSEGEGEAKTLRVTEVLGDLVTLDGNHPLAGQDLVFEIETIKAREATPEEISESLELPQDNQWH